MKAFWLTHTKVRTLALFASGLLSLLVVAAASAFTLDSLSPTWSNPVGSSGPVSCLNYQTVGAEAQVRFGDDDANGADCPGDPGTQSGLGFEGAAVPATFTSGEPFVLGQLTHYNQGNYGLSQLDSVDLDLAIDFSDPAYSDLFSTTVQIDETPDLANTCPYGDTQPCADQISVNRTNTGFNVGGQNYDFEILGFIPGTPGSCAYDDTQISTNFISEEDTANSVCLFGRLVQDDNAQVLLTKDTDPTGVVTVSPGDVLDFRIDYECSSITASCQNVQIFDFLPDAFEFVSATGSIHFDQGEYSASNHSILWDLRSSLAGVLSAGSTGFVRVQVRVRDDGTIPDNYPIDNVVVSTLDNGPTSSDTHTVTNSASSNWTVNKLNASTVYLDTNSPVTDVRYTVQICSSGSTVNLLNAGMVDTLPDDSLFVSATGGGVYNAGPPQTVTWDLGDLAASSGCTSRQVTVRYPEPTFTEGQNVTNSVVGTGDPVGEPAWSDTDSVTDPLQRFQPLPDGTVAKSASRSDWVVGATLSFSLNAANTGNISLDNFTITDTVPPEFDVTSVTTGGADEVRYQTNLSGSYVTWNSPYTVASLGLGAGEYITSIQWVLNTVAPGGTLTPSITGVIINPDNEGNPVVVDDTVTNTALLTYDFADSPTGPGSGSAGPAGATLTIVPLPIPDFSKNSAGGVSSQWRFLIGQQVGYYELFVDNDTGVALDDLTITDTLPAQFEVTSVSSGSYSSGGGVTTTVSYQTNLSGGYVVLGTSPASSNATFSIPALGVGEYVTDVRWAFGTVPAGFRASTRPRIDGLIVNPDHNGVAVNDNDSMTNNATLDWTYLGLPDSLNDSTTDPVREPVAQPSVNKTTLTSGPYIPTQVVTYQLRVGAASTSPSVMFNPIVMELLPDGLQYMPGTWAFNPGSTGASDPVFEEIPNYGTTGRTLLRWTFNSTFTQGQYATITFDAGLDAGVAEGGLTNEYYVTSNDIPMQTGVEDTDDLDGDGDQGDWIVGSSTTVTIDELVGLDSVKGVMGELDSDFSVYPATGRTLPSGDITYRLRIINQGNIPINHVKVIDILPFVGDTGVRVITPRLSEWRPVLAGLVSAQPGVTIYYSTSDNPCRPDVVSSGPAGCTAPNWSTLPPADITTVQSLRFDFAGTLAPGQTFEFTWDMLAPADAPDGSIAWNSFAFTSTNANTGIPLRPAEPNKVGIEIETPIIAPLIHLEKATNGDDADLPTGPLIPIGDPVTWTYVITNTGNTRLGNITLTDDQLGTITCNEVDPIPSLDPGGSFTCTAPAGVASSGQYANIGTVVGTPVDSGDVQLIDPDTLEPVPPVSDTDPSHYYGYTPALARLGDYVWIDSNPNGVQESGEPGLPGVTVNLYAASDLVNPLNTTTTNGSGFYNFVDIDVTDTGSDYVLEFVLPGVYSFTGQNQGGDTALDSDADPVTGRTTTITLNAGDVDLSWDAGVVPPASLGDLVWVDTDGDGTQDAGESGIENVTVRLYDGGGTLLGTTLTDEDGIYGFTDLEPGDYFVEFVLPSGYIFTRQDNSGDDTTDSDPDRATGRTVVTTLSAGENDPTWDAGIVTPASIGDRVWEDLDADGNQDGGESGIASVTVELFDSGGVSQGTTTTNASGNYSFTDLVPGDYYLVFTPPTDYEFSPQDAAGDTADSDANTSSGQTATTTLSAGENDTSWDAGMFQRASIGDFVWDDLNFDGVQDGGEPVFPNIPVELFNGAGVSQGTTTTNGSGNYSFTNLVPGSYYLVFTPPAGYDVTLPNQGGDDALDSDPAIATNQTATTQLISNEDDLTWDAGLVLLATLGDFVWEDINGDGVQDGGEPAVQNVTVQLYDTSDNLIATDTTDASGSYLFTDVYPGDYYVHFVTPSGYAITQANQGGDDTLDSDADATTGDTGTISLSPGGDDRTWDAGLYRPASLGNFVWRDFDHNGLQDGAPTEPGISGVTVNLYDSGGNFLAAATTAADGSYSFTNLAPGTYYVEFVLPAVGYEFTLQDQGGSDSVDSDADLTTGITATTTLDSGDNDPTLDAGLFPLASIGDRVWHDLDADGVQDGGETGVANVTVELFDSSDVSQGTTTTNGTGSYQFVNLQPGDYYLVFTLPAGYDAFSPQDSASATDATDSDANVATGQTALTTLAADEDDLTWDAGIYRYAAIGDRVWEDTTGNGRQDGGEPGVSGVTVNLYTGAGVFVSSTTTNGSGNYSFTGLVPGSYFVEFESPTDTHWTLQDVGGNAGDSDANPTSGRTAATTLTSGENDTSWDAGLYVPASLGDYVWHDLNGDGVQDGGEPGLQGVTVELFNGAGVSQGTTTTDANGLYVFDDLAPGSYYVEFTPLTGYSLTTQDSASATDLTDSDADRTSGQTIATTLISGEDELTWDAGMYIPASLGNFVWEDFDLDGVQDGGEVGLDGVTVELFNGAGVSQGTTVTAGGGVYSFTGLQPGDYYLVFTLLPNHNFSPLDSISATDTTDSDANTISGQTATTTLVSDEDDLTWDAGMFPLASLGDFVWDDLDADGVQDSGEPGVDGVTVELFDGAGVSQGTTTTAGGGLYSFTGLVPGDFYLVFSNLPAGYVFSPQDSSSATDATDSDADTTSAQTITTTLIADEDDLTWDAGIYNPASISNFVWDDLNADGVQDSGEPGVDGVTVELFNGTGVSQGTTTTAGGGFYLFDSLVPGDYYLVFSSLPTGYVFTPQNAGADDAVDSDAATGTGQTATTTLISNEDDDRWDAGIYNPASISNFVWDDLNANGIQDGGEPGVDGVTVELFNGAGVSQGATTTAGGGLYLFDDLVPGDYYLAFSNLPAGYVFSPQNAGSDLTDSDADMTSGQTATTTLISNEDDDTWDAGIYNPASISNLVWDDLNADGVQDSGEPGVDGVTVELFNGAGVSQGTTTTAGGGFYLFDSLVPGDYYLVFSSLPTGYVFTPQNAGADDAVDSDAATGTGQTATTTLISNEDDDTWDAGIYNPASISNFVWDDLNADGVQDSGEPGVDGVTVELFNGAGVSQGMTTTAGGGLYLFDNLVPGDYYLVFSSLPAGYVFSPQNVGSDLTDSDAATATGQTAAATLISNEDDDSWDAGIYNPASLSNFVWDDLNANGVQDSGEPGIPNVTVELFNGAGVSQGTTTTDADGLYIFDDLVPGDYYVVFTPPAGYVFTPQNAGADDAVDSDADTTSGQTATTTLISNQDDDRWDAGMYIPPSLGDFVWEDLDADGVQDGGEPGIPGVTVELFNGAGVSQGTTTTDADGLYIFDDLVPGDYYVVFTLPATYEFSPQDAAADTLDSDADTTSGQTITTTLISGEDDLSWDAALFRRASLGDYVWEDLNANGVQETGEPAIPNVMVELFNGAGVSQGTTTTDANGLYLFDNLVPGDYYVVFTPPATYEFTPQNVGGDTTDSDAHVTTGQTATTTLISDEDDLTWDAGMFRRAGLGDFVWEDLNADGIQDAGEPGVPGVTVELFNGLGVSQGTTTTDADGLYRFDNLVPDNYYVVFTLPAGYDSFSPADQGGDDAADSDADPITGQATGTAIISAQFDPTWDAGIYRYASLGDYVWVDANDDGAQGGDEAGIENVVVNLYTGAGTRLASTTTDTDGLYRFDNLVPGDYFVEFEPPPGFIFSPQDASGTTDATDSDAEGSSGRTIVTTLISNEEDLTWDAGVVPLGALGDLVWEDLNYNGIQDAGEPGVPEVEVTLHDGSGGLADTVTTDADGAYLFDHLRAGEYSVAFTLPEGYAFTLQDQGADDAADSDVDVDTFETLPTDLIWGEIDLTWDAGLVRLGRLGDRVWLDLNRNGVQEAGERGINGVTLTLTPADGSPAQTDVTADDGLYLFDDLRPGEYTVSVDLNTLPPGLSATYDLDGNRDSITTVPLAAGEELLTVDFGYAPLIDGVTRGEDWTPLGTCQRLCTSWQLYHTNLTGDWEIFRLGNLGDRPSISPNLSQGADAEDVAPSRSPNAEWIVFASDRDGNWEIYAAPTDGDGSKIRRITHNAFAIDTDPVWGPNNHVVFETTRNGNWDLYEIDMTTGRLRQLTTSAANDLNAYWSPDGAKLVFQSDRSGQWQIYALDLATLETTLLSDGTGADVDPQYSSAGDRIVFRSYREDRTNSVIYVMGADGTGVQAISDLAGDATNPSWSPDDSLIAYQSNLDGDLDIYVYELSSGTTRQMTDNDIADYAPSWQCDSTRLLFTSEVNGNPDIFDADALPIAAPGLQVATEAEQLTIDRASDIYPMGAPVEENASREGRLPAATLGEQTTYLNPDASITAVDPSHETASADWSPINGCPTACVGWSLYQSNRSGDWDIFRLDAGHLNISHGVGDDLSPSRSPDARWVAFTSQRDGNREIYVADAEGQHPQRVTFNDASDTDPVWSPDSQSIVYESDRSGTWNLYRFDVQTGVEVRLTTGPSDNVNAAWSSTGAKLTFQSDPEGRWQIYELDLRALAVQRLTDLPGDALDPLYAFGGSLIAFRLENDGHSVIYVMQEDGSDPQPISDPAGNARNQAWYVDDTLLAYQSDLGGDLEIYVYDFASRETRKVTDNGAADYAPTWVCGDPTVVFTSDVTGDANIFETPALPLDLPPVTVAGDTEQLTTSSSTDEFPVGTPSEENASRDEVTP